MPRYVDPQDPADSVKSALYRGVAAADPRERDQIDLLVLTRRAMKAVSSWTKGIVGVVFQHCQRSGNGGIGGVARVGEDVLGVELTRLGN
jgi:hypothetical protein